MNIWVIESFMNGGYAPVEIEYTRDQARVVMRAYKKRVIKWGGTPKTRIRRYQQDCFSRG